MKNKEAHEKIAEMLANTNLQREAFMEFVRHEQRAEYEASRARHREAMQSKERWLEAVRMEEK